MSKKKPSADDILANIRKRQQQPVKNEKYVGPEEQARIEEILKSIRDKEENEEYEGLHQVNNLEQGQEMLDIEKMAKKAKNVKDEENDVMMLMLNNYPIASIIGTAIMYGIDIHEQFGAVDGEKLIAKNKLGSLKGVLSKLTENT